MDTSYKPFFSRKQITALLWFSLLAILILSSLGPGDVDYQNIKHNDDKSVYWMELDNQPLTLTLLLGTPPALNETQQQVQQLKTQIISTRMRALSSPTYSFAVVPRQDRIELTIQWAADHEMPDLAGIVAALQAPITPAKWQEPLADLQARSYLESQSYEQRLINHFFEVLQPNNNAALTLLSNQYTALFEQITFTLSGEDAKQYAKQITKQFPTTSVRSRSAVFSNVAQQSFTLHGDDNARYGFLTGTLIPARSDKRFVEYRVAAQVVQDLLGTYQAQHGFKYRFLWSALDSVGYQALVLVANQNPGPYVPQLKQLVNKDLVKASQALLAEQWDDRMRQHSNQAQAMNLVAFYDLDTDTLEDYKDAILDADRDQVIALAQSILDTSQHINILLTPAL